MNELEKKLLELQADLKTAFDKAKEQTALHGAVQVELKTAIETLQKQVDAIDAQLQKKAANTEHKSFSQELKENESLMKLQKDGRGTAVIQIKSLADLERKTTIDTTAVGSATSGVLLFDRDGGVEMQPMKKLRIRNLLPSAPTSYNAIDYVKVNAFTNAASPQVEASDKAQAALTFTTATANVRTLAHWIPATKQILDDFAGLESTIRTELLYGYADVEEQELLSGSNSGQHLNGLITQATAYNTALDGPASVGWNKADKLARAIQQLEVANQTTCDWFVLNPADFWDIALTKDKNNNYLIGNAYNTLAPTLWGRPVVVTNNITAAHFLAGNSMKAQIRDREGVNIEISTEHSDYFIKNMVAIRCEGRLALVVRRPASYIYGTLDTSPA